jgi:hypothetical protein
MNIQSSIQLRGIDEKVYKKYARFAVCVVRVNAK